MESSQALIIFPLIAAILFAFASLALKRSSQLGAGVWQTSFVVNIMNALFYSCLWFMPGEPVHWELLWQPGLIALCLFSGMATQFVALERGDVSVAVPILGLKVLIVAFMTPVLIGEVLQPVLWVSAVLSVIGVTFLNRSGASHPSRNLLPAIVAGAMSATSFALFDVLVQKWGPLWGASRLLPFIFWFTAAFSAVCTLRMPLHLEKIKPLAWQWLIGGSILISLQSIFFVGCLAVYGQAAQANIFYSIRGLLTVILVWTVGHWFASAEQNLGTQTFINRLIGAVLILTAIILTILGK